MLHEEITEIILKSFYKVYNSLGYGFLEKVYENSMMIELKKNGLSCWQQQQIDVFYETEKVGKYYADIIVQDIVILELKAAKSLCEEHEFQLLNYLKATDIELGMLLNFGKKPQFKRKIFSNNRKGW